MTEPTNELDQLISTLAYAQSAQVVAEVLATLPDISAEAVRLLFTIPQLRGLLRVAPATGAHAAVQATYRVNLMRRAAYLAQAGRRITTAATRGPNEVLQALDRERRFLEQHLRADAQRTVAATQTAAVARQEIRAAQRAGSTWNGLLGWYAVMDERTSSECKRANGRNFDPMRVPPIGLPGSVHPDCRCRPGKPHATDLRVEVLRPDLVKAVQGRKSARKWTASRVGTLVP